MFRRQAGKGTAIGAGLRLISLRPTLLKDLPMSSAYIIVDTLITNQTLGDARRPLGQS